MNDQLTSSSAPNGDAALPVESNLAIAASEVREYGALPASSDRPAWQRDLCSISARSRAVIAAVRPIVVRAMTFWDHAVRGVAIGARRIEIDPSGSYRLR